MNKQGAQNRGKGTPAKGTMAKKFITNTTVGETLTKCKAIPTGTKTSNKFAQLERSISRNNWVGFFAWAAAVFTGYSLRGTLLRGFRCHQCRFASCTSCPCSKSMAGRRVGVVGEVSSGRCGGADVDLSRPGRVSFRSRPLPLMGIVDARLRIVSEDTVYDRGWPTMCFPTRALTTSTVSVSRHRSERTHLVRKVLIERQKLSSRLQLECVQRMPKSLNAGNFICWTADVFVLIGGGA